MLSLSTLVLAFFAHPIGSALFGHFHFDDKIGRKKTLVVSLVLMGGYGRYRLVADLFSNWYLGLILLCICRVGQVIGLDGEWGCAALAYNIASTIGATIAAMI